MMMMVKVHHPLTKFNNYKIFWSVFWVLIRTTKKKKRSSSGLHLPSNTNFNLMSLTTTGTHVCNKTYILFQRVLSHLVALRMLGISILQGRYILTRQRVNSEWFRDDTKLSTVLYEIIRVRNVEPGFEPRGDNTSQSTLTQVQQSNISHECKLGEG